MTIPRVWANGVSSMPTINGSPYFSGADACALDGHEQRALDKTALASQTATGSITIGPGGSISLDSSSASLQLANGFAFTQFGGYLLCGDDDFYVFSAPRTRTVSTALTEARFDLVDFSSLHDIPGFSLRTDLFPGGVTPTWSWYVDNFAIEMTPGTHDNGAGGAPPYANAALFLPLDRIHDGSEATAVSVSFLVYGSRSVLPARFPGLNLFRIDPFYGSIASITGGWVYFPTPANLAAYKNGATGSGYTTSGTNVVSAALTEAVDASRYVYLLGVLDEDYGSDASTAKCNAFTTASVTSVASGLRFQ